LNWYLAEVQVFVQRIEDRFALWGVKVLCFGILSTGAGRAIFKVFVTMSVE